MSGPRPRRIDQVVASLASRDAIGNHTLQIRRLLRDLGFESDIYYHVSTPDRAGDGLPLDRLDDGGASPATRWLLYQLSIGSPAADVVAGRPEPLLVNYHNITPADLLRRWEPAIAEEVTWGRDQLLRLADRTVAAVCDSTYNAAELDRAGYASTSVVPLLVDFDDFAGDADPKVADRLAAADGPQLLFVGKVAPHKAQHDLVKVLAVYRRLYHPAARLLLVGGSISDPYQEAVAGLAAAAGLADAVEFAGSVTHEELVAYYRGADAFVCVSEHEGFCVPIVEALYHRLPVVAASVAAVPETVGPAGVVVADRDPLRVAAAVHRVLADGELRTALAAAAEARIADLSLDRNRQRFTEAIAAAVGG